MKIMTILISFLICFINNKFIFKEDQIENNLWPLPNKILKGNEVIPLDLSCRFKFSNNISYFLSNIFNEILVLYEGIINKTSHKGIKIFMESDTLNQNLSTTSCEIPINIEVENLEMKKYNLNFLSTYESYVIKIEQTKNNKLSININALYLNGLVNAFETLSQILHYNENNSRIEIYNTPLTIIDEPSFAYRGLMIDTSRQFISIDKIKEILNGMLYSKLNVLHWHLADDDAFGFDSDLISGKNKKFIYTKSQIQQLVEYALIRGITIIPELDNPAHCLSWKIFAEDIIIKRPEDGVLDPSLEKSYNLTLSLIKEIQETFKVDSIHLGGDEIQYSLWSSDKIKEFMGNNNITNGRELLNYYFNRIRKNLNENNQTYFYWISNQDGSIFDVYDKENSVLMYWGMYDKLRSHLNDFPKQQLKRNIILTPADILYMDCGLGSKYGDNAWCGEYRTWKHLYNFTPFKSYNNFTVLGSQIVLFGEMADENAIIGKLFPRATSFSERVWTNLDASNEFMSVQYAFIRLLNQNKRIIQRGVKSISFTNQLCELEPLSCIENIK